VSLLSVSGWSVHRLRQDSSLNLCTVQPLTESDDTRCCINTIYPPHDERIVLETCRGMLRTYYIKYISYLIYIYIYMVVFLFNAVIYIFLLLCLIVRLYTYFMFMYLLYVCVFIVCLCIFIGPAGTSPTLTEVFPCFFLSCKANARVKPAKMGHGPHSS
jgi:hypothetical protein